jgi:hypothetical protein
MKNFKIIEGKKRFLVSAPHAYIHRRPSLLQKYKLGEKYTDDIVREICKESNCSGIYTTDKLDYDPNYHKVTENPYKREIENIIKRNKIKGFIDIHGLRNIYDIDIAIYYRTRFSNSILLAEEIADYIDRRTLSGVNIHILRLLDNDQETLTEYVASDVRIPAIQVEIARYIREDEKLRNGLVENISEYIKLKNN